MSIDKRETVDSVDGGKTRNFQSDAMTKNFFSFFLMTGMKIYSNIDNVLR